MGRRRPSIAEERALAAAGSHAVRQPLQSFEPNIQTRQDAHARTGQTFLYHTCENIAESWAKLQDGLNERQRQLEEIYGPLVELVNVYRQNNTRNGGIQIIAIFKIGPYLKATIETQQRSLFPVHETFLPLNADES